MGIRFAQDLFALYTVSPFTVDSENKLTKEPANRKFRNIQASELRIRGTLL